MLGLSGIIVASVLGLPIPFMDYVPFVEYYPATTTTWRAVVSVSIFLICICGFSFLLSHRKRNSQKSEEARLVIIPQVFIMVYALGLFAFLKFFVAGEAIQYLGQALASPEYYTTRAAIAEEYILGGRGGWGAIMAMNFVFPLITCFSAKLAQVRNGKRWWFVFASSSLASFLIALVFSQKSMLFYSLLFPVLALWVTHRPSFEKEMIYVKNKFLYIITSLIVIFFVSTMLFQSTTKLPLSESFQHAIRRVVFTPAMVGMYYYEAFPETFPFQGVQYLFSLEPSQVGEYKGITTQDVSTLITGVSENANTNFLAIAYAANGILGVAAVSFLIVLFIFLADMFLFGFNDSARQVLLLVNVLGLISIPEASFHYIFKSTGFISGSFIGGALVSAGKGQVLQNTMFAIVFSVLVFL